MPLARTRDYMSIGEVLDSVRLDFPDVTISKIRFLEAEGLIRPERTPSGYRKFFDSDVSRLRHILSLQKDHFMPLKVIKDRLAEADAGDAPPVAPPPVPGSTPSMEQTNGQTVAEDLVAVQMSRDELMQAVGLNNEQLSGLEEYGVLPPRATGIYDENDLVVAKAAQRFFSYGVEPRHLKMYRRMAEQEAAFFEQILTPNMRRPDTESHGKAARSLSELVNLSRSLRDAALRTSVSELR